jgi:hypothetical protein
MIQFDGFEYNNWDDANEDFWTEENILQYHVKIFIQVLMNTKVGTNGKYYFLMNASFIKQSVYKMLCTYLDIDPKKQ